MMRIKKLRSGLSAFIRGDFFLVVPPEGGATNARMHAIRELRLEQDYGPTTKSDPAA